MKRCELTPLPELKSSALDDPLPTRSRLFSLEPIGLGTMRAEGLVSYLIRLAGAHSVNPRRLIRTEFVPAQPEIANLIRSEFFRRNARTINGHCSYASAFCQASAALTGVSNLRYLTLLPLHHLLSYKGEGLLSRDVQWCPGCFAERAKSGQVAYRPLAWSFLHYRYCTVHQRPLVNRCPHCDSVQHAIPVYPSVSHCSQCGAWLGQHVDLGVSPTPDDLWISGAIEDIILNLRLMEASGTMENFLRTVNIAVQQNTPGNRTAFCRAIGGKRWSIGEWFAGRQPSLTQWLAVAYGTDMMPSRLFLPSDQRLDLKHTPLRRSPATLWLRGPKPVRSEAERKQLERDLREIAADPNDCNSLSRIAKRMHLGPAALRRWAQEPCDQIQAKYLHTIAVKAEQRRARDFEKLNAVVRELLENGEYPGGGKVNKRLRQQGVALVRPELKQAYREVLAEWMEGMPISTKQPSE